MDLTEALAELIELEVRPTPLKDRVGPIRGKARDETIIARRLVEGGAAVRVTVVQTGTELVPDASQPQEDLTTNPLGLIIARAGVDAHFRLDQGVLKRLKGALEVLTLNMDQADQVAGSWSLGGARGDAGFGVEVAEGVVQLTLSVEQLTEQEVHPVD